MNHVAVGEQISIGGKKEARTGSAPLAASTATVRDNEDDGLLNLVDR